MAALEGLFVGVYSQVREKLVQAAEYFAAGLSCFCVKKITRDISEQSFSDELVYLTVLPILHWLGLFRTLISIACCVGRLDGVIIQVA